MAILVMSDRSIALDAEQESRTAAGTRSNTYTYHSKTHCITQNVTDNLVRVLLTRMNDEVALCTDASGRIIPSPVRPGRLLEKQKDTTVQLTWNPQSLMVTALDPHTVLWWRAEEPPKNRRSSA